MRTVKLHFEVTLNCRELKEFSVETQPMPYRIVFFGRVRKREKVFGRPKPHARSRRSKRETEVGSRDRSDIGETIRERSRCDLTPGNSEIDQQ